jgi:TM2 domain-containing membrane protein YozV
MKLFKTLFLLVLFSQYFNAQSQSLDWSFTQHLIQNENYAELQLMLNENKTQTDTITFLKGWCYLMQKKTNKALYEWENCNSTSDFGIRCIFYSALLNCYNNMPENAFHKIQLLDSNKLNNDQKLLLNLYKASIYLISKKQMLVDSLAAQFAFNNYIIADEQKEFIKVLNMYRNKSKKSAALAGLFSAIIPGSGKFYIGNGQIGGGIGSLLVSSSLGVVAWEQFNKSGLNSIGFFVASSAFLVFYAGNILGSIYSTQLQKDKIEKENFNYLLRIMQIAADRQLGPNRTF